MKLQRIEWIDIARGLGIILVIYGHALSGQSLRYLIYAFHMPLFFFISGLVHHYKKSEHLNKTLQKSITRNLLPYYKFALLTYFAALTINGFTGFTFQRVTYQLFGILYGSGNLDFLGFNVVLWFLPCLFITKLIFFLIEKISDSKKFLALIILVFSTIGYLFSIKFNYLKMPFGLEIALTGIVFFGLGYIVEGNREIISSFLKKYALFIFPITILITIFFARLNFIYSGEQVDMRLNNYGNYFYFYAASLSGILSCLIISIQIGKSRVLEYLGKNSLLLFVWHWIVFVYLDKIIDLFIHLKSLATIRNTYLAPIYTVFAISLILSLGKLYPRLKHQLTKSKFASKY